MIAWQAALLIAAFTAFPIVASGQQYPERPVRLVVPYPPGGAADLIGRTLATKLAGELGQQLIVDNRGGGGQVIGTEIVARAPEDGYTVLLASITHSINPTLVSKLPYDTLRDFTPISYIATSPLVLVTHPSLPVRSTRDLVALAKEKSGQLNYASSGNGSGGHLAMALFLAMTKTRMVHVPYKGAGPALTDLIAGQVQCMLTSPLAAVPHAKAGKLQLLAVTGKTRVRSMPDVPAVAEAVPGYETVLWYALLAPAGTPPTAVAKLNAATRKVLSLPDVRTLFEKSGAEASGSSPEELQAIIRDEIEKWRKVIREANITRG